jgi:hypothetical protein
MKKPYFQYFFDISLISQEIVDNPRTKNDQHKIPYKIKSFQERSNDLHVTMGGSWWKHPCMFCENTVLIIFINLGKQ